MPGAGSRGHTRVKTPGCPGATAPSPAPPARVQGPASRAPGAGTRRPPGLSGKLRGAETRGLPPDRIRACPCTSHGHAVKGDGARDKGIDGLGCLRTCHSRADSSPEPANEGSEHELVTAVGGRLAARTFGSGRLAECWPPSPCRDALRPGHMNTQVSRGTREQ